MISLSFFSYGAYERCSSPLIIFVALHWILSNSTIFLLCWGAQNWTIVLQVWPYHCQGRQYPLLFFHLSSQSFNHRLLSSWLNMTSCCWIPDDYSWSPSCPSELEMPLLVLNWTIYRGDIKYLLLHTLHSDRWGD